MPLQGLRIPRWLAVLLGLAVLLAPAACSNDAVDQGQTGFTAAPTAVLPLSADALHPYVASWRASNGDTLTVDNGGKVMWSYRTTCDSTPCIQTIIIILDEYDSSSGAVLGEAASVTQQAAANGQPLALSKDALPQPVITVGEGFSLRFNKLQTAVTASNRVGTLKEYLTKV